MKTSKKLTAASLLACVFLLPACASAPAWEEDSEARGAAAPAVPELTLDELGLRQLPIEWDEDASASYSLLCMKSEAFLLIDGHRASPPVVRAPVYDSYCER